MTLREMVIRIAEDNGWPIVEDEKEPRAITIQFAVVCVECVFVTDDVCRLFGFTNVRGVDHSGLEGCVMRRNHNTAGIIWATDNERLYISLAVKTDVPEEFAIAVRAVASEMSLFLEKYLKLTQVL